MKKEVQISVNQHLKILGEPRNVLNILNVQICDSFIQMNDAQILNKNDYS